VSLIPIMDRPNFNPSASQPQNGQGSSKWTSRLWWKGLQELGGEKKTVRATKCDFIWLV
jgi:hypothetical protein